MVTATQFAPYGLLQFGRAAGGSAVDGLPYDDRGSGGCDSGAGGADCDGIVCGDRAARNDFQHAVARDKDGRAGGGGFDVGSMCTSAQKRCLAGVWLFFGGVLLSHAAL